MNSSNFTNIQSTGNLSDALSEIMEGIAECVALGGGGASAPVLSPMEDSVYGEVRFGNAAANTMTITGAEFGLVGMGGNDTLTGSAEFDWLSGDYFDVDYFNDPTPSPPFDTTVIGNDVLYGGGGDDALDGGVGNDLLYGGDGDDYFTMYQENLGLDTIRGGAGWDTISFYDAWDMGYDSVSLAALDLGSAASVEEFFSDVHVYGTAAANVFDVSGIEKFLFFPSSGVGRDTGFFDLRDGNDRFVGSMTEMDSVKGGNGNDTLIGNGGNDTLDGGNGDDSLVGGRGNDEYTVNSFGDIVRELSGQGIDTVRTTLATYKLGANVENLTNIGSTGLLGTGNGLKNTITGNSFNDTLNGGLGNDTLTGKGGADVFVFNTALGPTNVDTITDFSTVNDTIHLQNSGPGMFNKIKEGELSEAAFKIVGPTGSAVDANDRILYNASTGRLSYDADGSGSGAAITFAFLTPDLNLTASDFLVI